MKTGVARTCILPCLIALCCLAKMPGQTADNPSVRIQPATNITNLYQFRKGHPDGIGKFYQGREIAHVMGHQGADWLERPERDIEERPDLLIPLLQLKPGQQVADIGAGTGYFARRMARLVAPGGAVHAVEIQQEMLDLLVGNAGREGIHNIKPVLGTIEDPKLPGAGIDLVIMVDVYHEFSHPFEMMSKICESLKPGGRVAFVEYRAEDPTVPIKGHHKMSEAQVKKEASLHPLTWVTTHTNLPRQHVIIFRRN